MRKLRGEIQKKGKITENIISLKLRKSHNNAKKAKKRKKHENCGKTKFVKMTENTKIAKIVDNTKRKTNCNFEGNVVKRIIVRLF